MDLRKYDEDFVKKYHDDAEDNNYLYEYKSGEFQGGEVIGMQTISEYCKSTKYNYEKDTTQTYVPILEFITEEGYRETDLQFPLCDNC
jgi:hypothetical protein